MSLDKLRSLQEQPSVSPRPWSLIWDTGPGRTWDGDYVRSGVMKPNTLRIVDAENRLLVRIHADPEQALKPEDMQMIVEAVNAVPHLLGAAEGNSDE